MKVFIICRELIDGKDAQTTHVMELFKNLTELCNVYLFIPKPKEILKIHAEKNIIMIPNILTGTIGYIFFDLFLFYYLACHCFKNRPDIIYVRSSIVLYSYMVVSKIFSIPFIIEINGLPINEFKTRHYQAGMFKKVTNLAFAKLNEKLNYKLAKKILVVSLGIKKYIVTNYKINQNKISLIQNGANTDIFRPINQEIVRKKLNLNKNYNHIGFSGSFSPWHGLENLVRSALLILEKCENSRFLLVGDGIMKEQIYRMVSNLQLTDSFIFINTVPYEEVPYYINAFDIGVILKEKDVPGSPLKLWEYMACGIPIVATNSEDFHVFKKCNGGILVDPEKPEEIANAMLTLLKNKNLRREMGKNNRKYVVKNNSWEIVAKKVKKACKEAIQFKEKK